MNLKENIRRILKEETQGIDGFLDRIVSKYPETQSYIGKIKSFIEDSDCKKVEVSKFKYPALGLAVHNGVLFNEMIFYQTLPNFLFIIFHEIAHQYQYKKYGDEKMYEFYLGEINVKEAAIAMKQIEMTADEFASRKVREFVKLGLISQPNFPALSQYKNIPLSHFEKLINTTKESIKEKGITSFDKVAELFYNMVKINEATNTVKAEQVEGLHDTSWENDKGDKVTLIDLLDATKNIPVKKVSVNKLKKHLLTWDGDEEEIKKIEKSDLQYPILIFVEDDGSFISIIDGHHRAQKAVRKGLETIKAKIIPINSLPKDIRKVFSHMGKQEGMKEGEITEKCWKGYTQKGMKTMFGKRYPNCVKKKK